MLDLIINNDGGNELVESDRGLTSSLVDSLSDSNSDLDEERDENEERENTIVSEKYNSFRTSRNENF